MNKKIQRLMAVTLLAASGLYADSSTNKTYMNYRSTGKNLARQYGTNWHRQLHRPKRKDAWGSEFQATVFYEDSTNGSSLGKYFGFNGERRLNVGEPGDCVDIDRRHFIHDCVCDGLDDCDTRPANEDEAKACDNCKLQGTIKLSGTRDAWGVELSYYQNLDCLFDGFYFLINAPIIAEENHLKLRNLRRLRSTSSSCNSCSCNPCKCENAECGDNGCKTTTSSNCDSCKSCTTECPADCKKKCNDLCEQRQTIDNCGCDSTVGIADYFAGNVQQASPNSQAKLDRARIRGDQNNTELGDLDILVGWDFYREADAHVGVNVGLTFPTSSEGGATHVFDSQAGNGDHWGLGAGATATFTPWSDSDQELEVVFALNYRYLFESSERRTLGIKGHNWGQYMNIGTIGCVGIQPAANALTSNVDVTPGSEVDALIGLAYTWDDWTLDIGYNIYARESEDIDLKRCSWVDCAYGFAGKNYCSDDSVEPEFTRADIAKAGHAICRAQCSDGTAGPFINRCDLDKSAAETPSFATHKLYAGIGYTATGWEYPMQFKLGTFYEWASSRKSPENWSIFGGLGISW